MEHAAAPVRALGLHVDERHAGLIEERPERRRDVLARGFGVLGTGMRLLAAREVGWAVARVRALGGRRLAGEVRRLALEDQLQLPLERLRSSETEVGACCPGESP